MLTNIKSKSGQVADLMIYIIFIFLVTIYVLLFVSAKSFFYLENDALEIITDAADNANKTGVFTKQAYETMVSELERLGFDQVYLTLETKRDYLSQAELKDTLGIKNDDTNAFETEWNNLADTLDSTLDPTSDDYTKALTQARVEFLEKYEDKIKQNLKSTYTLTDSICERTLKKGDVLTVYTVSKRTNLFSKVIGSAFSFGKGVGSTKNIDMEASYTKIITNDGAYTGRELLNTIGSILNDTENVYNSINDTTLQQKYVKNIIKLNLYKHQTSGALVLENGSDMVSLDPKFLTANVDTTTGDVIIDADVKKFQVKKDDGTVILDTKEEQYYISVDTLKNATPDPSEYWIDPDGRYEKGYEKIIYDSGTDDYYYIMTIREVVE